MSKNQNIICVNCNAVILVSDIELCIAEMEPYQEMFNTTKHKLKQLKKLVKHKIKAEIVAVNN